MIKRRGFSAQNFDNQSCAFFRVNHCTREALLDLAPLPLAARTAVLLTAVPAQFSLQKVQSLWQCCEVTSTTIQKEPEHLSFHIGQAVCQVSPSKPATASIHLTAGLAAAWLHIFRQLACSVNLPSCLAGQHCLADCGLCATMSRQLSSIGLQAWGCPGHRWNLPATQLLRLLWLCCTAIQYRSFNGSDLNRALAYTCNALSAAQTTTLRWQPDNGGLDSLYMGRLWYATMWCFRACVMLRILSAVSGLSLLPASPAHKLQWPLCLRSGRRRRWPVQFAKVCQ